MPHYLKYLLTGLTVIFLACTGMIEEANLGSAQEAAREGLAAIPEGRVSLYVYRIMAFAGQGRVHQLKIDDRTLGLLTDANYYHLTLWPGRYHLDVHLPAETFLGRSRPAMDKSLSLVLEPRQAGRTFLLAYEDGEDFRRMEGQPAAVAALVGRRTLARALTAEETAHVDRFLDTRYVGPSLFGRPHGKGTLLWEDGCRYDGVFNHGQLTPEGKFFFADGRYFMGQLDKGRPRGRGALFSPAGRVLFAGPFEVEVPHGRGIRQGPDGPEYCRFEHGVDITRSIPQLAEEALDAEEREAEALIQTSAPQAKQDPEGTADGVATPEKPNPRQRLAHLRETREWRTVVMRKTIAAEQQEDLQKERAWCGDERSQGRDWCICAPFDPAAGQWRTCKR